MFTELTSTRRLVMAGTLAALTVVAGGCADDSARPGVSSSGTGGGGSGGGGSGGDGLEAFDWGLPPGFPVPKVPTDNPMSEEKIALGRRLFYDKRMSGNETYSCASCHRQELAFTDGRSSALGSTGEHHSRGSMSIVNVGYLTILTWGNPLVDSLEEQALLPMFGETPVELGLTGKEQELLVRLQAEPLYEELFSKAFPGDGAPMVLENVTKAIAAFERSLISSRSAYDRYTYDGDGSGMSEAALRGKELFFSEKLECFHCHGGFNLSDSVAHEGTTITEVMFHNTGLYNIGGTGAYPTGNAGIFEITGTSTDMGRFRAPTLRNIAVTAPYMHDGSVDSLEAALDHYAAGGRTIASGPYAGVGSENRYKSELINAFTFSGTEKADVVAFLQSLTDDEFLHDPRFADPWTQAP